MFTKEEVSCLRELAKQVLEISLFPEQESKRETWKKHNTLKGNTPIVFVSPDGAWSELLPTSSLMCQTPLARSIEYSLRGRLVRYNDIQDDVPIEARIKVEKVISNTMWGVTPLRKQSSQQTGAWHYEPIINEYKDWEKLSMPIVSYDEQETIKRYDAVCEILGDILPIDLVGVTNFSFHMMHWYCDYRGMENMMIDLIEEPEMVHERIRFFTDGIKSMLRQYEKLNLLSLNNNETFHYTGGVGYTDELPNIGFNPDRVRLCDVWAAAEAQEFSSVSPSMHEEFILSYERELLEPFGLNGYGCCDDLGKKLDGVLKINNLRRVAICPWADISDFTPRLKKDYIMTWKPQPSYLATDKMDEESVRKELSNGLKKARGGIIELILRDTHTCRYEPKRFVKWVSIARECIETEMEQR
ncbi:MAG: hypothetical protein RR444_02355 [Oscillospiraceae bacterium]